MAESVLYAGYGIIVNAVDAWTAASAFQEWMATATAFRIFARRHKSGILAYNSPEATAKKFGGFLTTQDLVEHTLNLYMHRLRREVITKYITLELEFEDDSVTEDHKVRTLFSPPCDAIWEPSGCPLYRGEECPCSPGGACHCDAWGEHIVNWNLTFRRNDYIRGHNRRQVRNLLASYGLTLISEPGKAETPHEQTWVLGLQAYSEDRESSSVESTGNGACISTSVVSNSMVSMDFDPDMEEDEEIKDGICEIDPACLSITEEEKMRFHKIVRDLGLNLRPPGTMLLKRNTPKLKSRPLTAEPAFLIIHQARTLVY